MYSLADFGVMARDAARMAAFGQALAATVRPESVVVDVGAGIGLTALLACRSGAKRVYAIEPSQAIQVAREAAAANGCADRIVFMQAASREVSLPEPADILLHDLSGTLPWLESSLQDVIDARIRFLGAHGKLLPGRDTVFCAVVDAGDLHHEMVDHWRSTFGLDFSAAARYAANTPRKTRLKGSQLVSAPAVWRRLDYATLSTLGAQGRLALEATRASEAHGLVLWFDSEFIPGISLTNAPGRDGTAYGEFFLPWPQPVALHSGDRIDVELRVDLVDGEYAWTWETRIEGRKAPVPHFRQSTFLGVPRSAEWFAKLAATHRPVLNPDGVMHRFVLDKMNGNATLAELGLALAGEFPARFGSEREAIDFVSRISVRFSK